MSYEIKLDIFEGPLDLLLYLIKKNEIDIYNIPIALIAEQYLQYLDAMRSLNLDLAGEYLVLASTLIHIKSKLLLPVEADENSEDETEGDPREELVRQLLEYQAFKEAALKIDSRPLLERDVFVRGYPIIENKEVNDDEVLEEINLFELVDAFQRIIATLDNAGAIEINAEKMTLADRINDIMEKLTEEKTLTFSDILGECSDRKKIVYSFLAVLELMKLRMIRVYQSSSFGIIRIFLAVEV